MGIRQKSIQKDSEVGLERFHVYVANTGVGSGPEGVLPIALFDVAKVEVVELGCAAEGTLSGGTPTHKALLEYQGDAGFQADGTDVAESAAAGDVGATDEWGLTRFDPPTEVALDYTAASTKLNKSGNKHSTGSCKLSLKYGGDATAYTGWVWAVLRITRIDDL